MWLRAKKLGSSSWTAFVMAVSAALTLAIIGAWELRHSYNQTLATAEHRNEVATYLVSEWLKGAFRESDYVLRDLENTIPHDLLIYPPADQKKAAKFRTRLLEKLNTVAFAYDIRYFTAECIQAFSVVTPSGGSAINNSYCNHFFDSAETGNIISELYRAHDGVWRIVHSRPIRSVDGDLLGVVGISLDLSFFQRWLDDLSMKPGDTVTLLDASGTIIARRPATELDHWKPLPLPEVNARIEKGETSFNVDEVSPIDGVRRLLHIRKVKDLPFFVVSGTDRELVLSHWNRQLRLFVLSLSAIFILSLLVAWKYAVTVRQGEDLRWRSTAMDNAGDAIVITDPNGRIEYVNPAFCAITNFTLDDVIGKNRQVLISQDTPAEIVEEMWENVRNGKVWRGEMAGNRKDGQAYIKTITLAPIMENNKLLRVVAVESDITERKAMEAKLYSLATLDSLTGVANRRRFLERGDEEVERALRFGHPLSLLMLDIDHFKRINDTWSHAAGDQALKIFAATCGGCVRSIDILGRIGGEEFAVLLPETDIRTAALVGERIRIATRQAIVSTDSGELIPLTVSIGVATLGSANDSLKRMMTRADAALYAAKGAGRDRIHLQDH